VWKDICLFLLIFRILRQTSVRAGPRLNRHEIFPEAFGACAEFLADKPEVMQVLPPRIRATSSATTLRMAPRPYSPRVPGHLRPTSYETHAYFQLSTFLRGEFKALSDLLSAQ
jgi:hypothetical protein